MWQAVIREKQTPATRGIDHGKVRHAEFRPNRKIGRPGKLRNMEICHASVLEAENLWGCVLGEEAYLADTKKMTKARAKIVLAVQKQNYGHIQNPETSLGESKECFRRQMAYTKGGSITHVNIDQAPRLQFRRGVCQHNNDDGPYSKRTGFRGQRGNDRCIITIWITRRI